MVNKRLKMITKTIEINLDEDELLDDIEPEDIVSYLSSNGIGVYNVEALAVIVNNSLLKEKEIQNFLENLDDEIVEEMKKLLKKNKRVNNDF